MKHQTNISQRLTSLKIGKLPSSLLIVVFVFVIAVLQDYIYSRIQHTGFYLSESTLYNTFWIYFIPYTLLINRLTISVKFKNKLNKFLLNLGIGIVISFIHLFIFTSLFVFISSLIFSPTHRFVTIFNAALANQFYIALTWYVIFPFIDLKKQSTTEITKTYSDSINVKVGSKFVKVNTSSIQYISTDKPYTAIHVAENKFLANRSLKELEAELDPKIFLRVHRSSIVNINFISEIISRSNGDYDATLKSGQSIRLSRHFRNNWKSLLH